MGGPVGPGLEPTAATCAMRGGGEGASVPGGRDSGEQLGIFGELHGVLKRQSEGAAPITGDDQASDLDDLALTSRGGAGSLLCTGDVVGCGGVVAAPCSHHGEQGVLDGEVSHVGSMRGGADAGLTFH